MMARAQKWSRARTTWITLGCGLGHVGGSILIGAVLAFSGMGISKWMSSQFPVLDEFRGSLASWMLMGLGAGLFIWGWVQMMRQRAHSHRHIHEDGSSHDHQHDHSKNHMHAHERGSKKIIPWILFVIFVFGPCESLVPLMLAAWALSGLLGMALVASVFSIATLATILLSVKLLQRGIARISFGFMDRWSTSVAGLSLVLCGAAVRWLGA